MGHVVGEEGLGQAGQFGLKGPQGGLQGFDQRRDVFPWP